MTIPDLRPELKDTYDAWPQAAQEKMRLLRDMIYETAAETDVGPVSETLKWGQPSFVPRTAKTGSPLRLGYVAGAENPCRLYVHCATNLVDQFKQRFADVLQFEKNRAICLPQTGAWPDAELRHCIGLALTYHQSKHKG